MDLFSEVFSNLKTDNDLKAYLSDATIKRISTNRDRDSMRIYLHFNTLVPKSRIWKLEEEIRKQYFSKGDVSVRIIESFSLSEAYDAARLFEVYKDSILEEIYRYNKVMFGIIKKSDITFPSNDRILVTLEDSVVARKMEEDIHDVLFKIFCERCGKQTIIDFEYKEASEGKYRKRSEKAIEDIISSIEKNIRTAETMEKALTDDDKTIKSESDFDPKKVVRRRREPESTVSADPSVLYGRPFDGAFADICDIDREIQEVVLRGQILSLESREIKNEKVIVMFVVTDFTDSIKVKIFMPKEDLEPVTEKGLKAGKFVAIKGKAAFDDFDKELTITSVRGVMKTDDFSNSRTDNAEEKRVELHCHTKMSDMDGVSAVTDIIGQAMKWGHKAIAITDHGAVQAFPDAFHKVGDSHDFKVIYGVEGYLVDDEKPIVKHSKDQSIDSDFVVFDIETTGFSADKEKIIEIGAVKIREGKIVDRFSEFVNPERPIPFRITELTSIRDEMVMDAEPIEAVLPRFLEFSKGCIMVAHNADFDMGFIKVNSLKQGLTCPETYVDTVSLSRFLLPQLNSYKLDHVAKALSVSLEHHHRAVDDAECTALFFEKEIAMLRERNILTLDALNEAGKMDARTIMKLPTNHIIILAKNDIGRINLYRLISLSHVTYFHKKPRMPRSLIRKYREGLIIASACSAGELYSAVMDGKPDDEIEAIADFYDYLEIQPVGNNAYMIESDKSSVNTVEDLQEHNRKIVALGEKLNKPVVATCDVHFLNPEDEVYRRIIQAGLKFDDADSQAPLYLHTTDEMLEEFSYLGEEKAYEVVVKNSNLIADMCDFIDPVRPDKCPPVIPDSDKTLRKICYTKAHQIYGEDLPEIVSARLERELNSIISNGYAVMYIIAQKLVWKSNEDGYLVGSRGSVGSSFVATMAGITEVNPLSPHYICPECHYVDFDSDEVKAFAGRAGCDMPDKDCPVCGHKLNKDGFDIPFETFLGFKGNKEPDIDLNFSNEYQSKAHKYTEVIFGDGQTFKAGTIGTLADKTAYGFVMKYMEEKGTTKRRCEVDRIVSGCTGVRRTTGQHPGGIIVLPVGEDINTFTPVQHPANDMECGIVTTHFDYHSIDSNLLKLDILGHLDPTMIRKLEDLTGIDATQIPLDDKGVMSLFQDTSALKITPDQ
nr:PolC-type DNA polymerase III [Lachnospiraceae bacterium]